MLQSMWGVVHDGKIEPAEPITLPEGATVLMTVLPEDDSEFWAGASNNSLQAVWDNVEDDVYGRLLEE